ncbi:ParA family protein, partial [Escherichia coli]|nr:ParA family protein [Escherichia coli]
MSTFKDHLAALASQFDHCVIDTPPTLGLRMSAALIVANHVLSPIELEEYSIDGITKMLQTIFGVKLKW